MQQRHAVYGKATAIGLHGDEFGLLRELDALEIDGRSLHACMDAPLREGAVVSLGFENSSLLARKGVVRSCAADAARFRVCIEIESRLAA